jgi:ABC-type methionine transport system ATPase subunit
MGLADRIDFPSANLSGGQKQRVAVARALMNSPELVLADEPTGNLDRASANQVMDLIGQINREEGTTFLISTHDEKIAAFCRRQIVVVVKAICEAVSLTALSSSAGVFPAVCAGPCCDIFLRASTPRPRDRSANPDPVRSAASP